MLQADTDVLTVVSAGPQVSSTSGDGATASDSKLIDEEVPSQNSIIQEHELPSDEAVKAEHTEEPVAGCCNPETQDLQTYASPSEEILDGLIECGLELISEYTLHGKASDLDIAEAVFQKSLLFSLTEHPQGAKPFINLGYIHKIWYGWHGRLESLDKAIAFLLAGLQLCPVAHGDRVACLINLADALLSRHIHTGVVEDLEESICHNREATVLLPEGHRHKSLILMSLANSLLARFEQKGETSDLDEAIRSYGDALNLHSPGDVNRSTPLINLANCLRTRYTHHGSISDLGLAIEYLEEALPLIPREDITRTICLANLGAALCSRFHQEGSLIDLDGMINCYQEALSQCGEGNPRRIGWLSSLALGLMTRYKHLGDVKDLEESIRYGREAITICPDDHNDHHVALHNLAINLLTHFAHNGCVDSLEEAITLSRQALAKLGPEHLNRSALIGTLSAGLYTRFSLSGQLPDLIEAIEYGNQAIRPHSGSKVTPSNMATLSGAMWHYFEHKGTFSYLDESIQQNSMILELLGDSHPLRPSILCNLGTTLLTRFTHKGDLTDLEESIRVSRKGLMLASSGNLLKSRLLNGLGNSLLCRFVEDVNRIDMEESIACYRKALSLCHDGDPFRPTVLMGLANALWNQFTHKSDVPGLEEAISTSQKALELCSSGNPNRPMVLDVLGTALAARYELDKSPSSLEEAIQCHRNALSLRPEGNPNRPRSLRDLGMKLLSRFDLIGARVDIEEAITCLQEARALLPSIHPLKAGASSSLASAYIAYSQKASGSTPLFDEAFELFRDAVNHPTASVHYRFLASLKWVFLAKKYNHVSIREAYRKSLELLDRYVLFRPSIISRHERMNQFVPDSLASDAAACFIEEGDIESAIELLEQGRTVLWTQLSRYRTSLDHLRDEDEGLASELEGLSRELERSAVSTHHMEDSLRSLDDESSQYRKISNQWESVIEKIRLINGYENFLKAIPFCTLADAASDGPIIIVNFGETRSDAIILLQTRTYRVVPLPDASPNDIQSLSSQFSAALLISQGRTRRAKIMTVLRRLWETIVKHAVDCLQSLGVPHRSRIWWCPTSKMTLLPLHAAGPYKDAEPNLQDLFISSYTSTLSALIKARKSGSDASPLTTSPKTVRPKLLIIAQPRVPNQAEIDGVRKEVQKIQLAVPSTNILMDEGGTYAHVIAGLGAHNWVHFATHGTQNTRNPFHSCFHIHDRDLTLLDIVNARLPNAEFAFLSVCHGATGDENNPDETIHLAAGLQFCGFRSVIGTRYAMADVDGPIVAEEVYKHMFRKVGKGEEEANSQVPVDYRDAAEALNIATRVLKNSGAPIERWINFIHIGA